MRLIGGQVIEGDAINVMVLQEVGQSTRSHQHRHHFTMFLLLVLVVTVSPSLALDLEKLFRDKISDARCFSQCQC